MAHAHRSLQCIWNMVPAPLIFLPLSGSIVLKILMNGHCTQIFSMRHVEKIYYFCTGVAKPMNVD